GGVAMVRRKGHTDVRQPIPLAPEVREWCNAWDGLVTWRSGPWLGRVSSEGSVTPGLTPDGVRHILKGWAAEIGVDKLRPHGLRHTHATLVLTHAGAATARCSLGHTSPATIQHYDDDEGRRIVEGASVAIKSIQESQ